MAKVAYSAPKEYGNARDEAFKRLATPIPRHRFDELVRNDMNGRVEEGGLARQIAHNWMIRKYQLAPRHLLDVRLLRYVDPERLEDHWQAWMTGEPHSKLRTSGLSLEVYAWPAVIAQALTGLLAGIKPMAYQIDTLPESIEPAARMKAEITEKFLLMDQEAQRYRTRYLDLVTSFVTLGRAVRMVTIHPRSRRIRTQSLWPGHVAAWWQEDRRTVEQVIVARNLSLGEAMDLYPDHRKRLESALYRVQQDSSGRQRTDTFQTTDQVTVLNCWYRLGEEPDERIGTANILVGDTSNDTPDGVVLLDADDDTKYPDIPVDIAPYMLWADRYPDEAAGPIQRIVGLSTEFDEMLSAYKDMVFRAIYPRFTASGFTYRNAPRINATIAGVIPLPRTDQRMARLDEALNTNPPEQLLAHLEELLIIHSGLNKFFVSSAPPSETSGEAIGAAINASIVQLEGPRTNLGESERWMYRMWAGLTHEYGEFRDGDLTVSAKRIIIPKPNIEIVWRDLRPREEVRAKQMAMAAVQQKIISKDTARDEWPQIVSKADEEAKIRREAQDVVMSPASVAQIASAIVQMAQARAMRAQAGGAGQPGAGQQGREVARSEQMSREAAAAGQPPNFQSDNEPGGVMPPTTEESLAAPPQNAGY